MERNFLKKLLLSAALTLGAVSGGLKAEESDLDLRLLTPGLASDAGGSGDLVMAVHGDTQGGAGAAVDSNAVIGGMAADTSYTGSLIKATGTNSYVKLDGTITVSGLITFYAPTSTTLTVSLLSSTILQAADMNASTGAVPSMVVFYAEGSGKINVYVDNDLIFTGSNSRLTTDEGARTACDLVVTFSGTGQTSFLISDSHKVEFGSLQTNITGTTFSDLGATGSGTKAYVMMDHLDADAGALGCATVVFQRKAVEWAGSSSSALDVVTTATGQTAQVVIGLNSIFTFITDNVDGVSREGNLPSGATATVGDSASVNFDVSNTGSGRVALWIKGRSDFASSGGSYDDGAFVLRGHPVCTTSSGATVSAGTGTRGSVASLTWANRVAKFVNLHRQGGYKAYLRVNNDMTHSSAAYAKLPRGLLVINDNASFPALASSSFETAAGGLATDLWNDRSRSECLAAASGSVKNIPVHGFILGVNGEIEVGNNLFFDYVGTTTPHELVPALSGFTSLNVIAHEATFGYKRHNPSALIVDGSTAVVGAATLDGNTTYSATDRNATITFRGTGKAFFRSGTATSSSSDRNVVGSESNSLGIYYSADPSGGTQTLVYTFTISSPVYNGLKVAAFAVEAGVYLGNLSDDGTSDASAVDGAPANEGFHIIDVEGKLTVQSVDDVFAAGTPQVTGMVQRPAQATTTAAAGTLNIPSIALNASGQEVDPLSATFVRPLAEFISYPRYQTSSILMNADVDFISTTLLHNDVTRAVFHEGSTYGTFTDAAPAIVGGEADAWLQRQNFVAVGDIVNTTLPLLALYNSQIALEESLAISGVRLVVHDNSVIGDNTSSIVFYHHGRLLDGDLAGRGRVLVLGSGLNRMGNQSLFSTYTNYANQKFAAINVYRFTGAASNNAELSLTTSYGNMSGDVVAKNQKSNHFIHLSPNSYISLGWTTTVGANYDPVLTTTLQPWNNSVGGSSANQFSVNNSTVNTAKLTFAGENIIIDGERNNTTPPISFDESGVLYVNYGGRIFADDANLQVINNNSVYAMGEVDVPVGVRIYGASAGYAGLLEFSQDQVVLMRGAELYNLDMNSIYGTPVSDVNPGGATLSEGTQLDLNRITSGFYNGDLRVSWNKVSNSYSFNAARSFDEDMDVELRDAVEDAPVVETVVEEVVSVEAVAPEVVATEEVVAAPTEDVAADVASEDVVSEEAALEEEAAEVAFAEEVASLEEVVEAEALVAEVAAVEPEAVAESVEEDDLRATPIPSVVTSAVTGGTTKGLPTGMLQVSAGQTINQLRVAGATVAQPFHVYVTGSEDGSTGVGRIYEIATDYFINNGAFDAYAPGAGQHGCIFMDNGGRIGLGSRKWNMHSQAAWNLLGKQYVTLFPNGDCVVDLNDDIIITDNQAIIPTSNFGTMLADVTSTDSRIAFYSQDTHEIRIPAGVVFDLSAFGHPDSAPTASQVQKIEIGGRARLVFEAGSTLRFPQVSSLGQAPVLYLNDEAELIFEGTKEINKSFIDYSSLVTKITGCGQIWVNKNAKIKVFNEGLVSVSSDLVSPTTSVAISIQRQGQFLIGDDTNVGGAFYVGNLTDVTDSTVSFSLIVNGPQAQVSIGRLGLLGLGVGVVDQSGSTLNSWTLKGAYNVNDVTIRLLQGTITHNQMYAGSSSNGSVIALGPVSMEAGYFFALGNGADSVIRGGGNLLYVTDHTSFNPAVDATALDSTGASGSYSLLATTEQIRQVANFAEANTVKTTFQTAATVSGVSCFSLPTGGSLANIYDLLRMPDLDSQMVPYVALSRVPTGFAAAYILLDAESNAVITRNLVPTMRADERADGGLRTGSLKVQSRESGVPSRLALP